MAIFNIVPREDQQGKLGLENKRWEEINAVSGSFSETKTDSLKTTDGSDLLLAGSNVTITQDPSTSQYTISSTGGGANVVSASTIAEGIIRISTASEFSLGSSTLTAVTPAQISLVFNEIDTLSGSISGSLANINNNPAVGDAGVIQISDGSNSLAASQWTITQAGTNSGSIIPSINDAFDIGEPEHKVRDLYLGQNSIKFVKDGFIDLTQTPPFSLGLTDNDELSINGDTLSSVAFSGDYNELLNLPVIPDITGGITYKGQIDLTDNTVTIGGVSSNITDISFTQGDLFAVSVAGDLSGVSFDVNDHVIFNQDVAGSAITDSVFDKIDNTDIDTQVPAATTFSTGSVILATLSGLTEGSSKVVTGDLFKLENLTDVEFDSATDTNKVLKYDGTNFVFSKGVVGISSSIDEDGQGGLDGVIEIEKDYDIIPSLLNTTSSLGSSSIPWNEIHGNSVTINDLTFRTDAADPIFEGNNDSSLSLTSSNLELKPINDATASSEYVSSKLSFSANKFNTSTSTSALLDSRLFLSSHDLDTHIGKSSINLPSSLPLIEQGQPVLITKEDHGLFNLSCTSTTFDNQQSVFNHDVEWISEEKVEVINDATETFALDENFNTAKVNTLIHNGSATVLAELGKGNFLGQTVIVKNIASGKPINVTTGTGTKLDGLLSTDVGTLVPLTTEKHDALTFKLIEIDSNTRNCSWIII
jgi:hypothetical protein